MWLWVRWKVKQSLWEGGISSSHYLWERFGDCGLSPEHRGVSRQVSVPRSLSMVSIEVPPSFLMEVLWMEQSWDPLKETDDGESSQSQFQGAQ